MPPLHHALLTALIRALIPLLLVLALWPGSAVGQCCQDINEQAQGHCAGGCTVPVTIFWNDCPNGQNCYKNQGDTKECPSPCDGEFVYTATVAGICVTGSFNNLCDWWVRYFPILEKNHIPRLYAIDCNGDLRQLLVSDIPTSTALPKRDKTKSQTKRLTHGGSQSSVSRFPSRIPT